MLADNSQSLLIHDNEDAQTRGDWVRERLRQGSPWQTRLGQDFDVRNYVFDSYLRSVEDFHILAFDGTGTSLGTSLSALAKRFRGLPLAGVLLFTDGNRTDLGDLDWPSLPPVYPVVPATRGTFATSAFGTSPSARRTSNRPRSSSGPMSPWPLPRGPIVAGSDRRGR